VCVCVLAIQFSRRCIASSVSISALVGLSSVTANRAALSASDGDMKKSCRQTRAMDSTDGRCSGSGIRGNNSGMLTVRRTSREYFVRSIRINFLAFVALCAVRQG
jgi:hypothetical protein